MQQVNNNGRRVWPGHAGKPVTKERRVSASTMIDRAAASAKRLLPGLMTSIVIAMASTFVSEHYGGPTLLFALLIGMALHFLSKDEVSGPGINFAGKSVLRLGVALLGARISAGQIADLGLVPVAIVVGGVTLTILVGRALAGPLGVTPAKGVLTGGAVAICGASAAMAISAVLPQNRDSERDTLFTVIAVTTLSTIAMILYPLLVPALSLGDSEAGILFGGTIHDVAQVVGAGHLISDHAATVATYVKLMRVAMLVPAVILLGWLFSGGAERSKWPQLPIFLVAFVVLAALNSFQLIPEAVREGMSLFSRWCLVCAIAALGMKTSLEELTKVGWRSIALVVAETVFLLVFVLAVMLAAG
jgi:uncharacterized integral membrane protein (TIGR00698 family)